MAFSPDGAKLAVAQSDNIIFVYKLGAGWGEKKSIGNKFLQTAAPTAVCWPVLRPYECVFGLAEGKVKIGQLRSNKAATLYTHPQGAAVVSIAGSKEGDAIIAGHADGSMYIFSFEGQNPVVQLFANHPVAPVALSWGKSICAAGGDGQALLYNPQTGDVESTFDHRKADRTRDYTQAAFNPSGDCVVLGAYNTLQVLLYNHQRGVWEDAGHKKIQNLYSVSALEWKPDGSTLAVGNVAGCVDCWEACVKKVNYMGKFEFTYVSQSQVIVKRLQTGSRIVLKSRFGHEIAKVNIKDDRYLVAHTRETLLLGDLESCKPSEIPWRSTGVEKFIFDNPHFAIVYYAGEMSIVEYGNNEIVGVCRTENISPYLLSIRYAPASARLEENKKIAYLVDLQTVKIVNLVTNTTLATVLHDAKIDWLELNEHGTHLLFRDKRRQLHLYEIKSQKSSTLLSYCSYVQWVPSSNVVVAQNRDSLCVWYSIGAPDRVMMFRIKGDVEDIERAGGRTEVVVNEGVDVASYALDENLIAFGTAVEIGDLDQAADILDPLELTPDTEAMWMQLSQLALEDRKLVIAERCYAALGYVTKARYLHATNKMAFKASKDTNSDGTNNFFVKAKLSALGKQWQASENLLLEQGKVDDVLNMHIEMHHWEEAIAVAQRLQSPEVETLRDNHYQWLLETGQEGEVAQIHEREGQYVQAIPLYLKSGQPFRAAKAIMDHDIHCSPDLMDDVMTALDGAGMLEQLGSLYEHQGMLHEAKDAYLKGNAFRKALTLCKRESPGEVQEIEEEWGDWLMHQRQTDAAINHYTEAGTYEKAMQAATEACQWSKAVSIIPNLDRKIAVPYCIKIARYYEDSRKFEEAERYYILSDMPKAALNMYATVGKWDAAHRVATGYLTESEIKHFYTLKASDLENSGKLKDAEKMYITVKEYDLAINMYKKKGMYDQMIRLVSIYRKNLLKDTHHHLAQQLEASSSFKDAEEHYVQAQEWKGAVQMYRAQNMWDDALRVARHHGGANASKQVAYAWAVSLGGEEGAKLLNKFGLTEPAIDYAIESGAFMHAFDLAKHSMKSKLPEIHLKYAMFLEDEGKFKEAEAEFIRAEKPREAIDMYIHQQDWEGAVGVANDYESSSLPDVYVANARVLAEQKDFAKAEALCLQAKMPEAMIKIYKESGLWEEALRVAETYAPSLVEEIGQQMDANQTRPSQVLHQIISKAKSLVAANRHAEAIEIYMQANATAKSEMDEVAAMWEHAVKLAVTHAPYKVSEAATSAAGRLMRAGRFAQAADILLSADQLKDAIDVCMEGGLAEKAREIARGDAALMSYLGNQAGEGTPGAGSGKRVTEGRAELGDIDMLLQQGKYEKAKELGMKQGAKSWNKIAMKAAKQKIYHSRCGDAAALLAHCENPDDDNLIQMLKHVAVDLLGGRSDLSALQASCTMLHNSVRSMELISSQQSLLEEFKQLLEATHFSFLKQQCQEAGLKKLAAKQAAALLRYTAFVPADKAFYEAGMAMRESGELNMAFVYLNRYLDLIEAIDEPDSEQLDNADFADTDVPYDFGLPGEHFLAEGEREEVRDWVLTLSMDQRVEQALTLRTCDNCGEDTYAAGIRCHACQSKSDMCIVTGYPILPGEHVNLTGVPACRTDWNTYVAHFKSCPWTRQPQSPIY